MLTRYYACAILNIVNNVLKYHLIVSAISMAKDNQTHTNLSLLWHTIADSLLQKMIKTGHSKIRPFSDFSVLFTI